MTPEVNGLGLFLRPYQKPHATDRQFMIKNGSGLYLRKTRGGALQKIGDSLPMDIF